MFKNELDKTNIIDLVVAVFVLFVYFTLQCSICKSYSFFANYLSITITDVMITFYEQIGKNLIGTWTWLPTSNMYKKDTTSIRGLSEYINLGIWSLILTTKSDIDNIEFTLLIILANFFHISFLVSGLIVATTLELSLFDVIIFWNGNIDCIFRKSFEIRFPNVGIRPHSQKSILFYASFNTERLIHRYEKIEVHI